MDKSYTAPKYNKRNNNNNNVFTFSDISFYEPQRPSSGMKTPALFNEPRDLFSIYCPFLEEELDFK